MNFQSPTGNTVSLIANTPFTVSFFSLLNISWASHLITQEYLPVLSSVTPVSGHSSSSELLEVLVQTTLSSSLYMVNSRLGTGFLSSALHLRLTLAPEATSELGSMDRVTVLIEATGKETQCNSQSTILLKLLLLLLPMMIKLFWEPCQKLRKVFRQNLENSPLLIPFFFF